MMRANANDQNQEEWMTKPELSLTRRHMLMGASAAGALGAFGALGSAAAKAPMLHTQAPYFYRFNVGDFEATIASDGTLPLGDPHKNFLGLSPNEMDKQLGDNFLPLSNAVLEQNALVVNTGNNLILFDTGMGGLKLFGPTTGKLINSLKLAGIDPKDIDAVVMTHAHIDHCGGCMADDGSRHFPNAQYYITQADYDFWTDESKVPSQFKVFLDTARKNLQPNRDRLHFIKDGEEILPGVHAISAPGHTVGHTVFMINSGNDSLCYIGDLAHHPVLLLEKPMTEFMYDTDPKQSAKSRVKILNTLADNRTRMLAYHFAWPGIGHVAKQGDGFRYYPEGMKMDM
jgi:glyoxylase-like metal-dependent hydrolase (beta-lactamase superfamily II)